VYVSDAETGSVIAMADDRPVLNQINLVVRDMDAMIEFYRKLGAEIAPTEPPWDRHHRTLSMPDGLDFDLDSTDFAAQWNRGWPPGQTGPVVGFRVAAREAVDRIYEELTNAGYVGQQPPYDAFWGARYAVIADPEGNSVGIMSPMDPARRTPQRPPTE
jgi:catechol 2,3-dioxygenase-like lactoylglutathione lyase family enzyme